MRRMQEHPVMQTEKWSQCQERLRVFVMHWLSMHLHRILMECDATIEEVLSISMAYVAEDHGRFKSGVLLRIRIRPVNEIFFAIIMGKRQKSISQLRTALAPWMNKLGMRIRVSVIHPCAMEGDRHVH